MIEEDLKFIGDYFNEFHRADISPERFEYLFSEEYRNLGIIKERLGNVIDEVRKTLSVDEVLMLTWPEPGNCWAVINKAGEIQCSISDCEGSWCKNMSLREYFDSMKKFSFLEVEELYQKLFNPEIYDVKDGFLKFKEYRSLINYN